MRGGKNKMADRRHLRLSDHQGARRAFEEPEQRPAETPPPLDELEPEE
jgi:hypothetical protein